jgi:hypothetical protein
MVNDLASVEEDERCIKRAEDAVDKRYKRKLETENLKAKSAKTSTLAKSKDNVPAVESNVSLPPVSFPYPPPGYFMPPPWMTSPPNQNCQAVCVLNVSLVGRCNFLSLLSKLVQCLMLKNEARNMHH